MKPFRILVYERVCARYTDLRDRAETETDPKVLDVVLAEERFFVRIVLAMQEMLFVKPHPEDAGL